MLYPCGIDGSGDRGDMDGWIGWGYRFEGWMANTIQQGHLDTYRFCDEVWTFLIKDVNFKLDNQTTVSADKVKIVSCNSKRPGEA